MRLVSALSLLCACGASDPPAPRPAPAPITSASTAPAAVVLDAGVADAASEPSYDVEADREERLQAAHLELGANAHALRVASPFVLAGPSKAATHGAAPFIESVLAAYTNHRFDKSPTRAISIYVFPAAAQYHAFCRRQYGGDECVSRFGFYLPDERKIIMQGGAGGTLSHELAHPFYEADFPGGPTWLNEGIAALFEQPILHPKGEIHGGKNWRLPRLLQALGSPKESSYARLETLFGMTDEVFRGEHESLHYAMARYACQWLDEHAWLWPFYRAYRDGIATDTSGRAAFTQVVGKSPAEATTEWKRWLRAL